MYVYTPVATHLCECKLADDAPVGDVHLSVLVNPALTTQHVVDTGGHLVPLVVVLEPATRSKQMFLFNDALNTFSYDYMASVEDHSDSER